MMLEERGRVVAVEAGAVWVETQRRGSCGSCEAQGSCGAGVWQQVLRPRAHQVRARADGLRPVVGDWVILGVAEGVVLRGALQLYLWPLAGLLAGALLGQALGTSEGASILGAGAGLVVALLALAWRHRREAGPAVVLRIEPGGRP